MIYENGKDFFGDTDETISNSKFTAQKQTVVLDSTPDNPNDNIITSTTISGDIKDAYKSTIIGAADVLDGTNQQLQESSIVGDAVLLNATTFTGGADRILLDSILSDPNSPNLGRVVGDAMTVNGGSVRGGNDTIIVEKSINGALIAGDMGLIINATFIAGNDNIWLKGNAINATISADAYSLLGSNLVSGGNDNVTLGVKELKGQTKVENSNIDLGQGNDIFTAYSSLGLGAYIDGGSGNDKFIINTISVVGPAEQEASIVGNAGNDSYIVDQFLDGTMHGGAGNDSFNITQLGDGTGTPSVYGNEDNDKIIIVNANSAAVSGDRGNDSINISDTAIKINIDGGDGNDTISVKNLNADAEGNGSSISGGEGNDKITVTFNNNSSINADAGNDTITITTSNNANIYGGNDNDNIKLDTANAGSISGDAGNDIINIANANNGSKIYGGDEANASPGMGDKITVTNLNNSDINGGSGYDTIIVSEAEAGSIIEGGIDNDIINVTTLNDNASILGDKLYTDAYADKISVGTATNGNINAHGGDDSINISNKATESTITGGRGSDSITAKNIYNAEIFGDYDDATAESVGTSYNDFIKVTGLYDASKLNGGYGADTITVTTLNDSTVNGGDGDDSIIINNATLLASIDGGAGHDSIKITTLNNSKVHGDAGNDSVTITSIKGENNVLSLGDGNDSLFVSSNSKTNLDDSDLALALGSGNDTLQVNWAFSGIFASSETAGEDDGDTLITKGLGAATLNFGSGNDKLVMTSSSNKSQYQGDTALARTLGAGQDTLQVNWAFNGIFDTGSEGGTLITKGLNAKSELNFGAGNDGLQVIGALANRQINSLDGNDTVSISSTATNVQVDLGEGADEFSVGAMGKNSTLTYNADGADSITIKGTYNNGMVVDAAGAAMALSTGSDGGSITLDTLGTGQLEFGGEADNIVINKAIKGTSSVKKQVNTLGGNDSIELKGAVTHAIIDAGTGTDNISIAALSTGSMLKYDADTADNIVIKSTFNASTAQTDVDGDIFHGLATGADGGSITLDTLGTGKLQFGAGSDSLTINKALSGSLGLKDIFLQAGNDSVILNSVNGAVINGGADNDYISATGLGATGVLNGDGGDDTIQIGREYNDADSFKATATMKSGIIDGGADNDTIIIGNTLVDEDGYLEGLKGTLSGGKVYGGAGEDDFTVATLSGSGLMDGGTNNDAFVIINMSGGTISGGDGTDEVYIEGTFSRGTINGDAGTDSIEILTMSGGTINAGLGNDTITIANLKGGVINTNDDAEVDEVTITTMTGGTINAGVGDSISVTTMSGGVINDSIDHSGSIFVTTMTNGTINGNAGDDSITVSTLSRGTINGHDGDDTVTINTMSGGTINTNDGDDTINITTMNGGAVNGHNDNDVFSIGSLNAGTINAGEGDNSITINTAFNGGSIIAGKGNDTLTLADGVTLGAKYSINLGAGNNLIQVNTDLEHQGLILGSSHDNVVLGADVSHAKINLSTGNDTITTEKTLITTFIDAGSGNDSIDIKTATDGTTIYAGAGNDSIDIEQVSNKLPDGTERDLVIIDAGTGSDSINIDSLLNNDSTLGGMITYDTAGQDTIILNEYKAGMVVGANGKHEISTGTDGGKIELNTWTSGGITFGNGHDTFVLKGALTGDRNINLMSGNDSLQIDGALVDADGKISGTITLNSSGQDSIKLGTLTEGTFYNIDGKGDNKFYYGKDGGSLELNTWTSTDISFGGGHDTFILHSNLNKHIGTGGGNDKVVIDGVVTAHKTDDGTYGLEVGVGTDIVSIGGFDSFTAGSDTVWGFLKYDNRGLDSITINAEYDGQHVSTSANDKDYINGLSTGADGGFIHVDGLTEAGVLNLKFSDKNDHFSIDTLNITDDENIEGTNTSVDLGKGTDSISVNALTAGAIIYDTVGLDSIVINDTYNGTGIGYHGKDADDNDAIIVGISTGNDGGYVHVDTLTSAGAQKLGFGDGADHLSVQSLSAGLHVGLGAGNDSFSADSITFSSSSVFGGIGNDVFVVNAFESGTNGDLYGDGGNDKFTITTMSRSGTAYGGANNDTFNITTMSGGTADGGANNDTFTIGTMSGGTADGGDHNDTFTIGTMSGSRVSGGNHDDTFSMGIVTGGTIYGDDTAISNHTTHYTAGADRMTIDSLDGTVNIYGDMLRITYSGDNSNKFTVRGGNDTITVKGDIAGTDADSITIASDIHTISGAKTIIGGNDIVTLGVKGQEGLTSVTNTNIDLGHGNDVLTAYSLLGNNTKIDGQEGNDRFTINTIHGNNNTIIAGGHGTDTIGITTMTGGKIEGGTAVKSGNKLNADSITVKNASNATIYGDVEAGNGNDTTVSYNDIIKITSTSTDTNIYGGYGNDAITITTMHDGEVHGEAGTDTIGITTMTGGKLEGGTAVKSGTRLYADSITVKNASNATIYGDESIVGAKDDTLSYNDIIKITGTSENTKTYGGHGHDNISIANATLGSHIFGDNLDESGDGNDTITVTNGDFIFIRGNAGDDSIKVTTLKGYSNLWADAGDDKVTVTTSLDSYIYGGEDDDTMTVTTANRSIVQGDIGQDSITVTNSYDTDIAGGDNDDYIKVTNARDESNINGDAGADKIIVTNLIDSDLSGGAGADSITITTATYSTIRGDDVGAALDNSGNDTITITNANTSEVLGGQGNDSIIIKSNMAGGVIDGEAGNDNIKITTAKDGATINGGEGTDSIDITTATNNATIDGGAGDDADTIVVKTLTNSTILGQGGVDSITVSTANNGAIDTGAGADNVFITSQIRSGLNIISSGAEADNIYLNGGLGANANVQLKGDTGFNVAKNNIGNGFTMTSGTLTGSAGADTFTLASMTGGTINGGAGADTFTLASMTGGTLDGGDGNDTFDVTLSGASRGLLVGGEGADVFKLNSTRASSITIDDFEIGKDTLYIGKDTIAVNVGDTFAKGGNITVYFNTIYVPSSGEALTNITNKTIIGTAGKDIITVTGTTTNSKIYGRAEADTITVKTLTNSEIHGEDGADSITVTTMNSGLIDGGAGEDTITIGNKINKAISIENSGADEIDALHLTNGVTTGANITLSGTGGFTLSATDSTKFNMTGGTIMGSAGEDIFAIKTMTGGTIDGGAGYDATIIDDKVNTSINIANSGTERDALYLTDGLGDEAHISLLGTGGFDIATHGEIPLDISGGKITGSDGVESFMLGQMSGGSINAGLGNDSFTIITMTGGKITGSDGVESFMLGQMSGGSINAGLGNDIFTITNMTAGNIDGGAGTDSITITNALNTTLNFTNSGSEIDYLHLTSGITTGANVTLSGAGGFVVRVVSGTLFDMDGGTLTGSGARDELWLESMSGENTSIDGGAGNDYIVVKNMSGGSVNDSSGNDNLFLGTLGGTMSAGQVNAGEGNDTITVGKMTGGNINGGAGDDSFIVNNILDITVDPSAGEGLDGGDGNDTINLGNIEAGEVLIGALSAIKNFEAYAFDTITTGGIVTATDSADNILVNSLINNGQVNTGAGDDSIDVTTMTNGSVSGGDGNDSIVIENMDGGTISGGNGNDTFDVTNLRAGTINGDAGFDILSINNVTGDIDVYNTELLLLNNGLSGGSITGTGSLGMSIAKSYNGTSYTGFDMSGGSITGGDGKDSFYVNTMTAGTINGDSGNDNIYVTTMNDGTINGGDGGDIITITTMNGGTVDGGDGEDTIIIKNALNKTLSFENTAGYTDYLYLEKGIAQGANITLAGTNNGVYVLGSNVQGSSIGFNMSGGELYGSAHGDVFTVNSMSNGTIDANAGNDIFSIIAMNNGAINGDTGNDSITITTMNGGRVDGGAGVDNIIIANAVTKSVTLYNSGTEKDNLTLESGIRGGHVTLESDAGFKVSAYSTAENYIDMTSGSLTASLGADSITMGSMSGGTINGGAGGDGITLGSMTGGIINGDAGQDIIQVTNMTGGTINGGADNDRITLTNTSGGTVDGGAGSDTIVVSGLTDLFTKLNINNTGTERDTVHLDDELQSGELILNSNAGFYLGKNDTLGFDMSGGSISGSAGNDEIRVNIMTAGTINAGAGDDIIHVLRMGFHNGVTGIVSGTGVINAGAGADTINLTIPNSGSIDGGAGADLITVNNSINFNFNINNSGTERDKIRLTNGIGEGGELTLSSNAGFELVRNENGDGIHMAEGATLNGSAGSDSIVIDEMAKNAKVYAGDGDDSIYVSSVKDNPDDGSGNDQVVVDATNGRVIDAGAGNDSVFIGNIFEADGDIRIDLDGGAGIDTLHIGFDFIKAGLDITTILSKISNFEAIKIINLNGKFTTNGSANADNITVDSLTGEASLNGLAGDDTLTVTDLIAGTINGGDDDDTITISDVNGRNNDLDIDINGNAGADLIKVNTIQDSLLVTIDGGEGTDTISVGTIQTSLVVINNTGSEKDSLSIVKVLGGGTVTLGSNNFETTIELMGNGAKFVGSADDDSITVTSFEGGTFDGGAGKDTLVIKETVTDTIVINNTELLLLDAGISGGTIGSTSGSMTIAKSYNGQSYTGVDIDSSLTLMGAGNDTIYVGNFGSYYANLGGAGNDSINIVTMAGHLNASGGGADTITITNMIDGIVRTDNGGNSSVINIKNALNKEVTFENSNLATNKLNLEKGIAAGADVKLIAQRGFGFEVSNASDSTTGFNMSGGSLTGSAAADKFTINTMSNGSIDGGGGADSITITAMNGGSIDGGAGVDSITIKNAINKTITLNNSGTEKDNLILESGISGGHVKLESDAGFTVSADSTAEDYIDMTSGSLTGSAGADSITMGSMSGGTINGGADNDYISIGKLNAGTVDGGAGADTITISEFTKASISNTGTEQDTLYLDDRYITDSMDLTLKGDGGFYVAWNNSNGFDMSGGKITGSSSADYFEIIEFNGGNIDGGAGTDIIAITNALDTTLNFTNSGSEIDYLNLTAGVTTGANVTLSGAGGFVVSVRSGVLFDMDGGTLTGSGASDQLWLENLSGENTFIDGGAGTDYIIVNNMSGGTISDSSGNDVISIATRGGNMSAGQVNAGEGNDTITVGKMTGGNINGGTGDDSLTVFVGNETRDAILSGGEGSDTFHISNIAGESGEISISNFELGTDTLIIGSDTINYAGQSSITVGDVTVNFVNEYDTHTIADRLEVAHSQTNTGQGEAGFDSIYLSNGIAAGGALLLSGNYGFNLGKNETQGFDLIGGSVIGNDAGNIIRIGTLDHTDNTNNNVISSGNGADSITINELLTSINSDYANIINAEGGNDTINIASINGGSIRIYGGTGADKFQFAGNGDVYLTDFNATEGDTLWIDGVNQTDLISAAQGEGAVSRQIGDITIHLQEDASLGNNVFTNVITDTVNLTNDSKAVKLFGGIAEGGVLNLNGNYGYNLDMSAEGIAGFHMNGGIINGSTESDIINIGTMNFGSIFGNDGSETINIVTMNGGNIFTETDLAYASRTDDITITNMNGGSIDAGDRENTFTITNMNGGSIIGGVFDDDITITNMNGGNVYADEGFELIAITNMSGGSIDAGVGDDTVNITGILSGGKIYGGEGNDLIKTEDIDVQGDLLIDGGEGIDIVALADSVIDAAFNLSDVEITPYLTNVESIGFDALTTKGSITGTDGADGIAIFDMQGGTIDCGAGVDTITVTISTSTTGAVLADHGSDYYEINGSGEVTILGIDARDVVIVNGVNVGGEIVNTIDSILDYTYINYGNLRIHFYDDVAHRKEGTDGNDTLTMDIDADAQTFRAFGRGGADRFEIDNSGNHKANVYMDFDSSENDSLFINGTDRTSALEQSLSQGEASVTFDGITIYFT